MSPSPGLLLALIVVLATGLALVTIVLIKLWCRLGSLTAALAEADVKDLSRRLAALEETGREPAPGPAGPEAARPSPSWSHPGAPVVRLRAATVRIDAAEPSAVSGPTLIAVPDLTTSVLPHATASGALELSRRFAPIWDLADAGESADAIARSTGQPVGQIELILALRRQAAAGASERGPT